MARPNVQTPLVQTPAGAAAFLPPRRSIAALRAAAAGCKACPLFLNATQTVFGRGPVPAPLVLVGEQPGDQEDLAGEPFVGPSGRLLDAVLEQAGIPREKVYVTNAVKHFKFEPRGRKRIHKKPDAAERNACFPWLEAEVELVRPRLVVALGATAAQSVLGKGFKVTKSRGQFLPSVFGVEAMATVHPSSLLRQADAESRRRERAAFAADLARAAERIGGEWHRN